ncbi:unnamed protein product [Arabidopsis lyrata]|nr:uncharacterized protein LOC9323033 [Arabidopsis lyrata subsp. lyrata]CAH8257191.1 unnamed protein product [Arabidopsis lyrata]|eukprot:XP_002886968.2 uncharacterized protein LOC9323033 [Arabidopsis lyrata subsp. lyrata]
MLQNSLLTSHYYYGESWRKMKKHSHNRWRKEDWFFDCGCNRNSCSSGRAAFWSDEFQLCGDGDSVSDRFSIAADICSSFMVMVAVLVAAMVGVGVAAAMWMMGIAALVCCGREIGIETGVAGRMVESVVRELGYGRSRYLRDKSEDGYSSSRA